jgi:hypothetical protein
MTRLGDFLPFGRLFISGSFMKNTQLAQICVLLISKVKVTYVILTKRFGQHVGRFFKQTHLVTLGKSFGEKMAHFSAGGVFYGPGRPSR